MGILTRRPASDEVPAYFARYVARVPDGDIGDMLESQIDETVAALTSLSDADALHRYEPGKWSIKQMLEHVGDTERVFAYRMLRIGRADTTPLPGFEQDDYVAASDPDARPLAALVADLRAVRAATVALIRGLAPEAVDRRGTASGVEFSVRGIAWIIAGHELHHRHILEERYLAPR